jgi:hypothetical protein
MLDGGLSECGHLYSYAFFITKFTIHATFSICYNEIKLAALLFLTMLDGGLSETRSFTSSHVRQSPKNYITNHSDGLISCSHKRRNVLASRSSLFVQSFFLNRGYLPNPKMTPPEEIQEMPGHLVYPTGKRYGRNNGLQISTLLFLRPMNMLYLCDNREFVDVTEIIDHKMGLYSGLSMVLT